MNKIELDSLERWAHEQLEARLEALEQEKRKATRSFLSGLFERHAVQRPWPEVGRTIQEGDKVFFQWEDEGDEIPVGEPATGELAPAGGG